jgi:hypothetical protein
LRSGKPVIGIAQSGSDGIRDAGGIAIEFPTHPL